MMSLSFSFHMAHPRRPYVVAEIAHTKHTTTIFANEYVSSHPTATIQRHTPHCCRHTCLRYGAPSIEFDIEMVKVHTLPFAPGLLQTTAQGCELTSVSFNEDGHLLATRAVDDTVKLWDIRKLGSGVVKTFSDVPTHLVRHSCVVLHTVL